MKYKKGIIIAAGRGTRLTPATTIISKPLLPVFDKPMIYYALANLMEAGVREVLFISRKSDLKNFKDLFGNGSNLGMKFTFAIQKKQIGIPDAMNIGKNFVGKGSFILALADNLFIGESFKQVLRQVQKSNSEATLLAVKVPNPSKSGVIEYDKDKKIISIEEKPKIPKSNFIIPGFYCYNHHAIDYAKKLKPSKRGELEIVDIHLKYLKSKSLNVVPVQKNIKWFDTGDAFEMLDASSYVAKYQKEKKILVGSIELVALHNGWISIAKFRKLINKMPTSDYKSRLESSIK